MDRLGASDRRTVRGSGFSGDQPRQRPRGGPEALPHDLRGHSGGGDKKLTADEWLAEERKKASENEHSGHQDYKQRRRPTGRNKARLSVQQFHTKNMRPDSLHQNTLVSDRIVASGALRSRTGGPSADASLPLNPIYFTEINVPTGG